MRVSAKADYALRAAIELAAAADGPVRGERIAQAQEIPLKFLGRRRTASNSKRLEPA